MVSLDRNMVDSVGAFADPLDGSLWARAYAKFHASNPVLVKLYEHVLGGYNDNQDGNGTSVALNDKLSISSVSRNAVEAYDKKEVLIQILGCPRRVRAQLEKVFKFTLWADNLILSTFSIEPYRALAWSTTSILLHLYLNSSEHDEELVDGIGRVIDILVLYKIREDVYLANPQASGFQLGLVDAIVSVYTELLEYQISLVVYLSPQASARGLQDALESNDWTAKLKTLDEAHVQCTESVASIRHDSEQSLFDDAMVQISNMLAGRSNLQKELVSALMSHEAHRKNSGLDTHRERFLSLLASPYRIDKDSIPDRSPNTCDWVFSDTSFLQWQNGTESSLLWISSGPGCGKSVLSKCLIDENRLNPCLTTTTVAYFFFNDGQERRANAEHALAALIHQVLQPQFCAAPKGYILPNMRGSALIHDLDRLWKLLIRCASEPDAGQIVCLLDALDECEYASRERLLTRLVGFFSPEEDEIRKRCQIKFIITSRPYVDIHQQLANLEEKNGFAHLNIDGKSVEIAHDVHQMIKHTLPQTLPNFVDISSAHKQEIHDQLQGSKSRTHIWLYLVFEMIKHQPSRYNDASMVKELIRSLPDDLDEVYERILQNVPDQELSRRLLSIILTSSRPLRLDELNYAFTVATSENPLGSLPERVDLQRENEFERKVKEACSLFVRVVDDRVDLIHQTARQFLIHKILTDQSGSPFGDSIDTTYGHDSLYLACLRYFDKIRQSGHWPFSCINQDPYQRRREPSQGFEEYAQYNLDFHHHRWSDLNRKELNQITRTVLEQSLALRSNEKDTDLAKLSRKFGVSALQGSYELLALSMMLKLDQVAVYILQDMRDTVPESNFFNCAFIHAADNHLLQTIETLLGFGVNVNTTDPFFLKPAVGRSALYHVAAKSDFEMTKRLIDLGADANAVVRYESGKTATAVGQAILLQQHGLVKLLLDSGADVNIVNSGVNPLIESTRRSDTTMTELILKHPGTTLDHDMFFEAYSTALNVRNEDIRSMLCTYAPEFHLEEAVEVVRLVEAAQRDEDHYLGLVPKENLEARVRSWQVGPLEVALRWDYDKGASVLAKHGAGLENLPTHISGVPCLRHAAKLGVHRMVRYLLERGDDVNEVSGSDERTPLLVAAEGGHTGIVETLLDHGARLDVRSKSGYSAYRLASSTNHAEIRQLLMARMKEFSKQPGSPSVMDMIMGVERPSTTNNLPHRARTPNKATSQEDGN